MKRLALAFLVLAAICFSTSAGWAQYEKGSSYLGPRIGLGVNGSSLALGAGYEYGITPEISVGALIDYYQYSYSAYGDWGGKYTYIIFGPQGNYHFGKVLKLDSKLDPFAGLVLAYEHISWKWDHSGYDYWSPSSSGITLGGQAGGRYFFSPQMALYGQVGFGITYLKVGVDFVLK
jgi:hypothetical protein